MGSGVVFAKGLLAEIVARAHANRGEVCGLLLGLPDRVTGVLHCANVAPEPSKAFEIAPEQLVAAYRAMRAGGPRVVGCYHSHPDGAATPSARDASAAAANGWLWLIAAGGIVRVYRAVEGSDVLGRFAPLSLAEHT